MKLKEFRVGKGLSVEECAARHGVSDVGWGHWETGRRIPGKKRMVDLFIWSAGAVQPNDFYPLPDLHVRRLSKSSSRKK